MTPSSVATTAHLKRLDPTDARSWALWPKIEHRARTLLARWTPDTPADLILAFMRVRFESLPQTIAVWVLLDDDERQVIAHAVAWIEIEWGEPYILVHQVMADRGVRVTAWRTPVFAELRRWIEEVNRLYAQGGQPWRIRRVRFWTPRPSAVWDRYLKGLVSRTWSVKEIPVERIG